MAAPQASTVREPSSSIRVFRRVIAIIIVVTFSLAAAGGIIVLLGDIESELTFQVVSTTALTGAFSVAAFCGATLLGRRAQWFGIVTIGLAAASLALSLWFLWGDPPGDETLFQLLYSLILLTAVGSVASLVLLLASTNSWAVRIALALTLGALSLAAALTLVTIWVETAWQSDWLMRLTAIVWILAALGVVVVPLTSLLLRKSKAATPTSSDPMSDSASQSSPAAQLSAPQLSASALHRLEAAARAQGVTADELLDRLLDADDRSAPGPQS
jgi:hypothetical protein